MMQWIDVSHIFNAKFANISFFFLMNLSRFRKLILNLFKVYAKISRKPYKYFKEILDISVKM